MAGLHSLDEVDAGGMVEMDDTSSNTCLYLMVDSMDRLQLNVTPLAVSILQDVTEVLCVCVCVCRCICMCSKRVQVCMYVHSSELNFGIFLLSWAVCKRR